MNYTDKDLVATAERDHERAGITDMAADIGLFYAELIKTDVPTEAVVSLTQTFAVMVMFADCGCEAGLA